MTTSAFMTLDSRKRINLATIADRSEYKVTKEPGGRIVLDPAVVLTEDELAVLSDQSVWTAAERAGRSSEKRPRRRLKE